MNVFLLNRAAEPARTVPFLKDRQLNRGVSVLQYAWGVFALIAAVSASSASSLSTQAILESPLRGIWSVQTFAVNDVPIPALVTEEQRWRNVIFDKPEELTIQPMQGVLQRYSFQLSGDGKNLTLAPLGVPRQEASFTLETPAADRLLMTGRFDGHPMEVSLKRVNLSDPSEFLLTNRGFHWITQTPRWH